MEPTSQNKTETLCWHARHDAINPEATPVSSALVLLLVSLQLRHVLLAVCLSEGMKGALTSQWVGRPTQAAEGRSRWGVFNNSSREASLFSCPLRCTARLARPPAEEVWENKRWKNPLNEAQEKLPSCLNTAALQRYAEIHSFNCTPMEDLLTSHVLMKILMICFRYLSCTNV